MLGVSKDSQLSLGSAHGSIIIMDNRSNTFESHAASKNMFKSFFVKGS